MLSTSTSSELPPSWNVLVAIISGALGYGLLELILKEDRHAALAAAFLLHIFITFSSLTKARAFLWSGKIPLTWNLVIVLLSYLYSLFKSYAMKFLAMSTFLTGSNMQLVVAVIIGKIIFNSQYTFGQIVGVLLVVVGCTITTLLSSELNGEIRSESTSTVITGDLIIGSTCMALMLISIAGLMPTINYVIRKYNADTEEQLFMQHSLALPLFGLQWSNLLPSLTSFHLGQGEFSLFGHPVPLFFVFLLASTFFTHINRTSSACITRSLGSLTSQLVATLTKTVSTLISLLAFNYNFSDSAGSFILLLGVFLQTTGSVVYAVNTFPPCFKKEKVA